MAARSGRQRSRPLSTRFGPLSNYGDRFRHGERIATSFADSTVNQVISKRMVKKQQMRWTPRGAHLLFEVDPIVQTTRPGFYVMLVAPPAPQGLTGAAPR